VVFISDLKVLSTSWYINENRLLKQSWKLDFCTGGAF